MMDGLPGTSASEDAEGHELIAESAKRSVTDPLEVNFADATMADALQSKYTSPAQRFWGWVLLAMPCAVIALFCVFVIWKPDPSNWFDMRPEVDRIEDFVFRIFLSVVVLSLPIYWVVVLTKRQKGKRKPDH
jgi:hypothetical protein